MIVFLLALACSKDPVEEWASCTTLDCQEQTVVAAMQADATRVAEVVSEWEAVEQKATVRVVANVDPGLLTTLCEPLDRDSPGGRECQRYRSRPHLKQRSRKAEERQAPAGAASGPRGGPPSVPPAVPVPWEQVSQEEVDALRQDCDADCLAAQVGQLAARGEAEAVGLRCRAAWPEGGDDYGDCLFVAAEAIASRRGWRELGEIWPLCSASGRFQTPCWRHAVTRALPPAPPADAPGQAEIDTMSEAAAVIGGLDAGGGDWQQIAWTAWIHASYQAAEEVTGHLLTALPSGLEPHVRSAAAFRLLEEGGFDDFDAAVTALGEALARTGPIPAKAERTVRVTLYKAPSRWDNDRGPPEAQVPSTWFLVRSRRPVADDAQVDLQLALLEAAGVVEPVPPAAFFLDALEADRPELVRWSAARICAQVDPEGLSAAAIDDPSTLVTARLQGRDNRPRGRRGSVPARD